MLRAHRTDQMRTRLALGLGRPEDKTLVFSDAEGEMLWPDDLTRVWTRVLLAKKLPRVTFHALRHTHASMLIANGVDIVTISRRLGHSKTSTTLDIYGHLFKGADAVPSTRSSANKVIRGFRLQFGCSFGFVPPPNFPKTLHFLMRRGAGVVERDGLENRCTGNRTVGSNPTLSVLHPWFPRVSQLFLQSVPQVVPQIVGCSPRRAPQRV
jgi:Phage integrase family